MITGGWKQVGSYKQRASTVADYGGPTDMTDVMNLLIHAPPTADPRSSYKPRNNRNLYGPFGTPEIYDKLDPMMSGALQSYAFDPGAERTQRTLLTTSQQIRDLNNPQPPTPAVTPFSPPPVFGAKPKKDVGYWGLPNYK